MKAINRLEVRNFKSFREIDVDLNSFNVLIGANASGKSNFVQVFKFLRDIVTVGLDNAVSMQGGVEYIRNVKLGAEENLRIKIYSDTRFNLLLPKFIGITGHSSQYEFELRFMKRRKSFEIVRDVLTVECEVVELDRSRKFRKKEVLGKGRITVWNRNGRPEVRKEPENLPIEEDLISPPFFSKEVERSKTLLIQMPFFLSPPLVEILEDISIYDFDPKLPKRATPITGKLELEEDGSNLSIILKKLLEDKEKKRQLLNLITDLLPAIEDMGVEKFADRSLLFKLKERFFKNYIPASLISDGTVNITALIIALYFESKPMAIIEEPERNIHPHLISKIINMMREASVRKQILITTHNPEVVKSTALEDILLISRDEDGFSVITRPADDSRVKAFLKNEIGIDELYVQNLLELP
ncbi:MAG: AAA family ATPase [Aquificae bacterium]|nr:AAA family ATPase [Aquificota bacterium]